MVYPSLKPLAPVIFILLFQGQFAIITDAVGEKTNVIIFIVDDLGYGDVGAFGNDTIKTPNIDKLAADGATLTHHLAADSLCTPSRAALLTGRYPIRSGMACDNEAYPVIIFSSSSGGLTQEETTIGKLAKHYNYSTGFFGKWHLGLSCGSSDDFCHHPMRHGFDTFFGFPITNMADYGPEGGGLWGFSAIAERRDYTLKLFLRTFATSLIVNYLLFKRRLLKLRTIVIFNVILCSPFLFMFWHFCNMKLVNSMVMKDYTVIEQPIRFRNLTQTLVDESINFIEQKANNDEPFLAVISWLQVHTVLSTSEEFKNHSAFGQYGDNVEEMDWGVGAVMEALERLKISDNTFIYFTSDNGGSTAETGPGGGCHGGFNGILRGSKGQSVMDGGVRVPAVAKWKNKIKPNTIIAAPTSLMDILPTIVESIFRKEEEDMNVKSTDSYEELILDGKNIETLFDGTSKYSPHRFLFHYCCQEIQAVRYTPDDSSNVYKVYFASPKWKPDTENCARGLCRCTDDQIIRHKPPLINNIGLDASEKTGQISTDDPIYDEILSLVNGAIKKHKDSLNKVGGRRESKMNLMNMLPRPWMQLCCNFPYCECTNEKI